MRRRDLITLLGGAAAWPVVARAQEKLQPLVGFLIDLSADYKNVTLPFIQGLKETGYVEGQNVVVEYRYAENQYDRLQVLAADLIRRHVAVIVVGSSEVARAAKAATSTIPIVFVTGGDPVALGLVASLNRPGANVTGSANLAGELAPKRLQLLHDLIPNAAAFGVLLDPAFPSGTADLQLGARSLGIQLVLASARTDSDLEPAFATFSEQRVGAVLVGNSAFFPGRTEQIAGSLTRVTEVASGFYVRR
jgi:putative ABC transport system substrate-binding protein